MYVPTYLGLVETPKLRARVPTRKIGMNPILPPLRIDPHPCLCLRREAIHCSIRRQDAVGDGRTAAPADLLTQMMESSVNSILLSTISVPLGRPVAMLDCSDVTGGGSCRPMRRLREWHEVTLIFLCHSNPGGGSSAPHQDIALHIGISAAFYYS